MYMTVEFLRTSLFYYWINLQYILAKYILNQQEMSYSDKSSQKFTRPNQFKFLIVPDNLTEVLGHPVWAIFYLYLQHPFKNHEELLVAACRTQLPSQII